MKKYFSRIIIPFFVLAILFGAFGVAKVEAETRYKGLTQTESTVIQNKCLGSKTYETCITTELAKTRATPRTPEQQAEITAAKPIIEKAAADAKKNDAKGFFEWLTEGAMDLISGPIAKIVMTVNGVLLQAIAIPIMSILFRISAALLDMSVNFTLSTQIFKDTSMGVVTVWVLIRNICNITFIFILLWSAIQMIIGVGSAGAKKMVANVIIAALLINFSLFITRIVIDVGNILAVALFDQIQNVTYLVDGKTVSYAGQGLGAIIMQALGMSGITGAANSALAGGFFSVSFGMISYLQLITLIVAFIVFMYAMLLMAARIVALIFLAALSPIGFMGDVLPKLSEYSKMWRETLYGQVMIAPVFLLFIYLIIQVSKAFNTGSTGEFVSAAAKTDAEKYLAYFKYVMIIMLLIIAVKVTKKMTGPIGAAVEKFGMAAAGIAVGAATGGAALLATKTLGAGASAIRDSKWGEKLKDSNGFAARMTIKGLDKTAKSSFDARNTSTFKSATGFVGDQTGIKVDYNRGIKTQKDGFEGALERNTKRSEDYAKMVTKNMPEVNVGAERERVKTDLDAKNSALEILKNQSIPTEEKAFKEREEQIKKLEKEAADLNKRNSLDDKAMEKELEKEAKEAKKARVDKIATDESTSKMNWLVGGAGARKAAAAKVRKLAAEKTAAEIRKEAEKKQREENKAAGIKDEDEEKKEEKPKEEKEEKGEKK